MKGYSLFAVTIAIVGCTTGIDKEAEKLRLLESNEIQRTAHLEGDAELFVVLERICAIIFIFW